MKIAICDDNKDIAQEVKEYVAEYVNEKGYTNSIYVFHSGEELLASGIKFDIAFVDIEMGGMNGLATSRGILRENENAIILIITAFESYLDDVMDLSLYRFIKKPIQKEKVHRCLSCAIKKYMLHSKPIEVKTESENILVNTSDIIYVGIEGRRVTVETTGGTLKSCERFSYWKKTLDSRLFCQTHQSYIVNMHYVRRYTNNSVTLEYREGYLKKFSVLT